MENSILFILLTYRENKRMKLSANNRRVDGVVLALCCHHCCSWPQYVGRPFLQNLGFTAEEFHLLCCLSSWATCGIRLKKRGKGIAGQTDNNRGDNALQCLALKFVDDNWSRGYNVHQIAFAYAVVFELSKTLC